MPLASYRVATNQCPSPNQRGLLDRLLGYTDQKCAIARQTTQQTIDTTAAERAVLACRSGSEDDFACDAVGRLGFERGAGLG